MDERSPAAEKIGTRVREARERLGVSQQDLADLSEVNVATLGKIERGVQSPNLASLVKIATALEVDASTLVAGITAADYGPKKRQITVRDLIAARAGSGVGSAP